MPVKTHSSPHVTSSAAVTKQTTPLKQAPFLPFLDYWYIPATVIVGLVVFIFRRGIASAFDLIILSRKRGLDRSDKKTSTVRRLRQLLQTLEKQMSIARDYPSVILWAYDVNVTELHQVVHSDDATQGLEDSEFRLVMDALVACEEVGQVLAGPSQHQLIRSSEGLRERTRAAKRALREIYKAREALNDSDQLKWPQAPVKYIDVWVVGDIIPRSEEIE